METQIKSLEDLSISKILKENPKNSSGEYDFKSLANEIMNKIYIDNGNYKYHPIEIEFYIYDKENHADIHVYPRDNKEAGELFFHLSGMDICFKSSLEEGRFGGILIRALERVKDGETIRIGGPLTCVNDVLNTAKSHTGIQVVHCCNHMSRPTKCIGKRKGINQSKSTTLKDEYWNKKYRFLRDDLNLGDKITMKDDTFDFKLQAIKKDRPRKYKIED